MSISRKASLGVCCCLLLALTLLAQPTPTPNFSGYWKLDAEKSDFGGAPVPGSARYVIRHIGAKLTFDYTQESKTSRVEITTDGQERMTDSNADTELWTRAFWEGPVLVFEARQRPRPAHDAPAIKWTSRWKLSPDSQTLTIERQITGPQGEQLNQLLVFDRETKEASKNNVVSR
jgi:hypothetical protein